MITEELFSYNFQHFMTSYQRLKNGVVAASKQFVRLGLLEMQERDGSGAVTAENAWRPRPGAPGGIGGLLVRKAGEQKYTYMTNHLGHVYGVFDKTGNRVESHSYSAYGYAFGDDFSLQPFGMSTKRSDFASGLVYFGYRFYVPHPVILIPVSAYLVCRALGGCIIPDNLFNSWHRNESAESSSDSTSNDVDCPKSDVTKRLGKFRKKTIKDSWDNTSDGVDTDSKQCPDCGKDVFGNPHKNGKRNGPNGWDNDHQPKWKDRDLSGMDRKQVLDEYNKGTRLRCPSCNRADNQ